jgi:hypothetical protein
VQDSRHQILTCLSCTEQSGYYLLTLFLTDVVVGMGSGFATAVGTYTVCMRLGGLVLF